MMRYHAKKTYKVIVDGPGQMPTNLKFPRKAFYRNILVVKQVLSKIILLKGMAILREQLKG